MQLHLLKYTPVVMTYMSLGLMSPAQAEIYRNVDVSGHITFTDSAGQNGQRVRLPPLSIVPGLSVEDIARAQLRNMPNRPNHANDYRLAVLSPKPNQAFNRGADSIEVAVQLEPALTSGDRIQILVDGQAIEGNPEAISTEGLERGPHTLTIRLLSGTGRLLTEQSVAINVFQPSRLYPNRRGR